MPSRKIEDLQPLLQVKAKYFLNLCEQEWPGGSNVTQPSGGTSGGTTGWGNLPSNFNLP